MDAWDELTHRLTRDDQQWAQQVAHLAADDEARRALQACADRIAALLTEARNLGCEIRALAGQLANRTPQEQAALIADFGDLARDRTATPARNR